MSFPGSLRGIASLPGTGCVGNFRSGVFFIAKLRRHAVLIGTRGQGVNDVRADAGAVSASVSAYSIGSGLPNTHCFGVAV
jgi:hypothetical protein